MQSSSYQQSQNPSRKNHSCPLHDPDYLLRLTILVLICLISHSEQQQVSVSSPTTACLAGMWKRTARLPCLNFMECAMHMPPPSMNKASYSGFETQRRLSLEVQNMPISGHHKKALCPRINKYD